METLTATVKTKLGRTSVDLSFPEGYVVNDVLDFMVGNLVRMLQERQAEAQAQEAPVGCGETQLDAEDYARLLCGWVDDGGAEGGPDGPARP